MLDAMEETISMAQLAKNAEEIARDMYSSAVAGRSESL